MKPKFPSMTLEYLSLSVVVAVAGLMAGSWLSAALLARVSQVTELLR
jgi:hypothetical protein